jgi:hypothetical protein
MCDARPATYQEAIAGMSQPPQPALSGSPITTRAAIVARIEARISGQISDTALAAWAFDRFYAEELGSESYEAGAEAPIADVLDALMFGDDPNFRLDEEELRALIAQLGTL